MEATTAAGIQDQFLQLLTTQLRHQDPLEPTKQEDFIAQLAQFSTLEGIEKLNSNFSEFLETQVEKTQDPLLAEVQQFKDLSNAANLVGTEITFAEVVETDVSGVFKTDISIGVVEAVVLKDHAIHLRVGKDLINLDQIQEIGADVSRAIESDTSEPKESSP